MRKLVTRETILDIQPIADADAIEAVTVRGWKLVSRKGEFKVGDPCLYFEIDSALPIADERFAFFAARGTKVTVEGHTVHVLKTARMRGVYSQGLALPMDKFPEAASAGPDDDLAALLKVEKWEPPLPKGSGEIIAEFPTHLARKTDAERIQNLVDVYERLRALRWFATEKIDGTSATFIKDESGLRVCGRNYELSKESLQGELAAAHSLADRMVAGEVLQAELYGDGVQANPLKVRGRHLAVFGYFKDRVAVPRSAWPEWLMAIAAPLLPITLPASVPEAIAQIDGMKSTIGQGKPAEGVVWHTEDGAGLAELDGRACFKVISNSYLLKQG
jgi:RNA ligase (TIGR02306 family)